MKTVAIVGGGVTGLAAAWELERSSDCEIHLYEASDILGGKVQTTLEPGFVIEDGPDCFFARKPGIKEFVAELGLADQLIEPRASEFSIWVDGALHRVPRGITDMRKPLPSAVCEATFLSDEAKARALDDQPVQVDGDISIRDFFTARFGPEFCRLVVEPLLAGTHGGDPAHLSMRALYPVYLDGPVLAAPESGPLFLSFRKGMHTLVEGIAANLSHTRIHLGSPLTSLPTADRILLAVPAPAAARLLASDLLAAIPHLPATIATRIYRTKDIHLFGTGFLVPEGEDDLLTGATWSSAKWENRTPDEFVLVRYFIRSSADATTLDDRHFPWLSEAAQPIRVLCVGWEEALPQYEVGHLDRIAKIDQAMATHPHIFLAGTSYRGVGVPDSIRQGREAARKIAETL